MSDTKTTATVEPGIYYGMPFDEYVAIDAVNSSSLKNMVVSALNYNFKKGLADSPSKSMDIGRVAHLGILEPEKYNNDYIVYDGIRRGKEWESFKADNMGKEILNVSENERVNNMMQSASTHVAARKIISDCTSEVTVIFIEQSSGILCKARIDCYDRALRYFADLKTAREVEPWAFARQSASLYYHFQYAFYRIALHSVFGVWIPVKCIAVQNNAPFDTVVFNVSTHTVDVGMKLVMESLTKLKECRESGDWPGISSDEVDLELPAWAVDEEEEIKL